MMKTNKDNEEIYFFTPDTFNIIGKDFFTHDDLMYKKVEYGREREERIIEYLKRQPIKWLTNPPLYKVNNPPERMACIYESEHSTKTVYALCIRFSDKMFSSADYMNRAANLIDVAVNAFTLNKEEFAYDSEDEDFIGKAPYLTPVEEEEIRKLIPNEG